MTVKYESDFSYVPVKPVIAMPHDAEPGTSGTSKSAGNEDPSDDIAFLTANVTQPNTSGIVWGEMDNDGNMTGFIVGAPVATSTPLPVQGKGKGVGKGSSGSSGPPVKRRRQGMFQVPLATPKTKNDANVTTADKPTGGAVPVIKENATVPSLREPAVEHYMGVGIQERSYYLPILSL